MLPTVEENEISKLHFADPACSFFFDEEAQAWVIEPDDEEQDALVLESPEHPFEPTSISGVLIDKELFDLLVATYKTKDIH